jgi:hypothetical protein
MAIDTVLRVRSPVVRFPERTAENGKTVLAISVQPSARSLLCLSPLEEVVSS